MWQVSAYNSRMKYSLVTIRPQGFAHSNGFRELQESVGWALAALGHESNITENAFANEGQNIVFGAELVSPDSTLPPNTIIYNIEQDSHPAFHHVLRLGRKAASVWEYSAANLPHWKECDVEAVHVPFGYTPNLTRIPKADNQGIDVFFSGWLTDRRKKILDELRSHGLNVVAVDNVYAGSRDNLISRAKVCLNIMHDGRTHTNIQRLSFWMANSKCIVSEIASDQKDYPWLEGSIINCAYGYIVEMVRHCVKDILFCSVLEGGAFNVIRKQDYVATIARALEFSPKPNPILERYERGCREGDMKEYLPWLRANARGMCLEIGTRDGASTSAILLGLERNCGVLTSVDIKPCVLWKHDLWEFVLSDSKQLQFFNEFDFILIDGDHTREGFLTDLHNCYRWAKNGAMIAVHDVSPPMTYEQYGGDFPSFAVGQEFDKFCGEKSLTSFYLPGVQGMGVLVVKK
jgi:hypothetical protein